MKDTKVLGWIYHNSKVQFLPLAGLIIASALFAGCSVLLAFATRGVIDSAAGRDLRAMMTYGLGYLGVILLQLTLRTVCRGMEVSVQGRLEQSYRTSLFGQLMYKDYMALTGHHSGELMNRLTGDLALVAEGVATFLPNLAEMLTRFIAAITVLYILDRKFALIFVAGGLFVFVFASVFRKRVKHLHRDMQEKEGVVRSLVQEALEAILAVKTFGAEKAMQGKAERLGLAHYQARLKKNILSIFASAGFSFVFSLGSLYALLWGAYGLFKGSLSFGMVPAILQLVGQVQTPVSGLSGMMPKLYSVFASAERLMDLENIPDEQTINASDISAAALYDSMDSIMLEDVSFSYGRETVLSHMNITINKGDFVVVSGMSGIGKSTFMKLLLGVLYPDSGSAYLNLGGGKRLAFDRQTRKLFAYVPQGNLLLSGTIRDNIAFINNAASDAEIMAAAELSCAAGFIETLPVGLDTVIGENGIGLSEGQAQRIAIARAVLSGAPVMLLDEATSALDEATEKQLLENFKTMTDKTLIIISHKKAACLVCGKEIHIEQGAATINEGRNGVADD